MPMRLGEGMRANLNPRVGGALSAASGQNAPVGTGFDIVRSKRTRLLAAFGVCLLATVLASAGAAAGGPGESEARLASEKLPTIVLLQAGVEPEGATQALEQRHGFSSRFRYAHALRGFAADLNQRQRERLAADPRVALVTADKPVFADAIDALAPGRDDSHRCSPDRLGRRGISTRR